MVDLRHLLSFRARHLRRPGRAKVALGLVIAVVLGAAALPALHPDAGGAGRAFELLLLLPTLMAGFLLLAVVSAVASGGGREILPRDEAVAFPVSSTTDHLGALLLAPLNIAWIVQSCALLGTTAFALGFNGLLPMQLLMLGWIFAATAIAQVIAWTAEAVRRTRYGIWTMRAVYVSAGAGFAVVQMTGQLARVLDQVPTLRLFNSALMGISGHWWRWAGAMSVVLAIGLFAIALGAWSARVASRRMPRDEQHAETSQHQPRRTPGSDLAMLLRIDRGSVWRTVPMRRGLAVLAVGPGLVALAGGLPWQSIVVLPGLVASGGALLYGVNAWCLDERGGLWRESLPVHPRTVFAARSWVLAEWLGAAAVVTVLFGAIRAGVPSPAELASILAVVVVVTAQVVSVAMTWANRRPFAVSMRSARATPAPPAVMVGYSAKLATTTTLTGVCFSVTAQLPSDSWFVAILLAVVFLCWSGVRYQRARGVWLNPQARSRVVTTMAC